MNNSEQQQARLSRLVQPRESGPLNIMDAEAMVLQEQHRRRYDSRILSGSAPRLYADTMEHTPHGH